MKRLYRNASQTSILKTRELHPILLRAFNFNWMKSYKIAIGCILIICAFTGKIAAQESALIKIDPDRQIDTINPNIYSAFVEPIRTVV